MKTQQFVRAVVLTGLWAASCHAIAAQESAVSANSTRADWVAVLEPPIRALQTSQHEFPFLVIAVDGDQDFVQFARGQTSVVLDFPVYTERQRTQLPAMTKVCAALGLAHELGSNQDGSSSLACVMPGSAATVADQIAEILIRVFGVSSTDQLALSGQGLD